MKRGFTLLEVMLALAIFALATGLSLVFYALDFSEANIIMAYILGVLLTAVMTSNRLCSSATSIASVFIFNYLFTEPRFTLRAYDTGYPVTFIIMLLAALMTGGQRAVRQQGESDMAGSRWYWRTTPLSTGNALLQAVDIEVSLHEDFSSVIQSRRAWFSAVGGQQ